MNAQPHDVLYSREQGGPRVEILGPYVERSDEALTPLALQLLVVGHERSLPGVRGVEGVDSDAPPPDDPLMLYLQADILAAKNSDTNTSDFRLAMRSAQRAVALRPSLGAAHGVLAKLYMQSEKYPEAVEQCRKALAIDPSDQTVVYRLIQALRKTGDRNREIPDLLKRLASLREQAIQKDKERYRFKLVD